ncbi:MAG: helix-turn-helix domain-containing protein [Clostridia bacterium]|nr:helix-turn-helix domain-containing protein [Clostridia bacterium]
MSLRHDKQTDALFESILQLRSVEECYTYFEDLCTVREIRDLGQRLEVARLLRAGSSYQQAASATGVSSATVGRVKKCLDYGPGGYEMIMKRMEADTDEDGAS